MAGAGVPGLGPKSAAAGALAPRRARRARSVRRESGIVFGDGWGPPGASWGGSSGLSGRWRAGLARCCGDIPQVSGGFGLFCGIVPQDPPLSPDYFRRHLARAAVFRGRLHSFRFFVIPGSSPPEGRPVAVKRAAKAYRRDENICVTVAGMAGGTHGSAPASATIEARASAAFACGRAGSAGAVTGPCHPTLARHSRWGACYPRDNSAQRLCRDQALQPSSLLPDRVLNHSMFTIG